MMPVILGTTAAGMTLIRRLDQDIVPMPKVKKAILAAGLWGSGILRWKLGPGERVPRLLLSVFLGCLLLACITDLIIFQVHNFVWWVAGTAAGMLLWIRLWQDAAAKEYPVTELLLFWGVQLMIFGRMYGRADCYAFCVCALAELSLGYGLKCFVVHMFISFGLMTAAQMVRKNIGPGGRLRKPVPFLPYITAGFYVILCCMDEL